MARLKKIIIFSKQHTGILLPKLLDKYSWIVVEVATLVCATLVKANEGSSLLINLIQNTVLFFQSPPTQ